MSTSRVSGRQSQSSCRRDRVGFYHVRPLQSTRKTTYTESWHSRQPPAASCNRPTSNKQQATGSREPGASIKPRAASIKLRAASN